MVFQPGRIGGGVEQYASVRGDEGQAVAAGARLAQIFAAAGHGAGGKVGELLRQFIGKAVFKVGEQDRGKKRQAYRQRSERYQKDGLENTFCHGPPSRIR